MDQFINKNIIYYAILNSSFFFNLKLRARELSEITSAFLESLELFQKNDNFLFQIYNYILHK